MYKGSFVTMECHGQNYRIYISDILRVHSITKRPHPYPPPYISSFSGKSLEKETAIDFDSYSML
jgi:hypothetical protein